MKVVYGSEFFESPSRGVMTLGIFDGFHKGHQKLIQKVVESSQKLKVPSALYTMDPHPAEFLNKPVKRLFPLEQIIETVSEWGLNFFIVEKFSKRFSQTSSFDFVKDYVYRRIHPQKIIIGEDFRFGLNRQGNVSDLTRWGKDFSFQVEVVSPVQWEGRPISSTWVRSAYRQAQISQLNHLLGRPFLVKGEVVSGKRIGSQLGFPTANIRLKVSLEPQKGVYICKLKNSQKTYLGVMNFGVRPTLNSSDTPIMEVHVLNSPQINLKGQSVEVEILSHIRNEQKFDSPAQLTQAIREDIKVANSYFFHK